VTYQLLIYADYADLLGESICTVKKNVEALLVTSKENGLEQGHTDLYGNGPHHVVAALGKIT
jgi:hypothetical protein